MCGKKFFKILKKIPKFFKKRLDKTGKSVIIIIERGKKTRKENKTMTRQEIEAKIEELETREFYLKMKDFWSRSDFDYNDKLHREIRELKEQLKGIE